MGIPARPDVERPPPALGMILAWVSLLLAFSSILFMFFTGLPAAAVGYVAKRRTPEGSPTHQVARFGMRMGLIVSAVWVGIWVLFILLQSDG